MRIGIFGSQSDAQCQALSYMLNKRGARVALVESTSLSLGEDIAFLDGSFYYRGECLDDVQCWFLRYVMSPLPPTFEADDEYFLFADWYVEYMHHRECYGYQLSWLLTQSFNNIPVVNPPEHGSVVQLKLFQLAAARELGLPIPRTIITNNSDRVREFHAQVGDVVFKPSMGGGICRHLDDDALSNLDTLKASPVTFQERVQGEAIRIVIIGGDVVSCVRIPSDHLDYRADPNYTEGNQIYHPLELDVDIADKCWQLMQACGLLFSGIDLILTPDGSFVFLEANSSPIYLDIEQKTEVAITDALANYLVKIANDPERYRQVVSRARRSRSFVSYALPFHPDRDVN